MRQARPLVMDSVEGFVQKAEGDQLPEPASRNNAAGRTIHRLAGHAHMLDVFAPALQVRGQQCRPEIHPEKIFPDAECGYEGEDERPSD